MTYAHGGLPDRLPAFFLGRLVFLIRAYEDATALDGYDPSAYDGAPGGDHFGQGAGLQNSLFHTSIIASYHGFSGFVPQRERSGIIGV
jgi:hypothetical protein